ncbi:MAG: IMPACT family protein [Thermoanaerobaculia bacterium]
MPADHYRTVAARSELRQKIERSEFLGIALPVTSEREFLAELESISKRHFDATHHCWAFRLFESERSRSSDAGEPSGTAGKQILSAIEGAELHDTGVVVVRWYGGVKLGTGGLSRAYRETAARALEIAPKAERYLYATYDVIVPYDSLGVIYRVLDPPNIVLRSESFGDANVFVIDVRRSMAEALEERLRELRLEYKARQAQ